MLVNQPITVQMSKW